MVPTGPECCRMTQRHTHPHGRVAQRVVVAEAARVSSHAQTAGVVKADLRTRRSVQERRVPAVTPSHLPRSSGRGLHRCPLGGGRHVRLLVRRHATGGGERFSSFSESHTTCSPRGRLSESLPQRATSRLCAAQAADGSKPTPAGTPPLKTPRRHPAASRAAQGRTSLVSQESPRG